MPRSILAAALAALAACAGIPPGDFDDPGARSRAIDHDIGTTFSADQNLRATPPGQPLPIEGPGASPRF
jgi:hypothetical protein